MSLYRLINPTMNRLLKSPWHQLLSKRIMTVSYRGRKSAKPYSTPVSYLRDGDTVYCFTNGSWRHNFLEPTESSLRIRGQDYSATGQLLDCDRALQIELMTAYFKAVPQDRKFYGVSVDSRGEPLREQVERATQVVDVIKFELQGTAG